MNNYTCKGSSEFYEKNAEIYDNSRFSSILGGYINNFQKELILSFIDHWSNIRVLDLGCGTGRFSVEIAKMGAEVISVDPSISMLKQIEKRIDTKNSDSIHIDKIQSSGYLIPLKDNSCDGCICINVMDHIQKPNEIITEVMRVLKKNGFLITNFSNLSSIYFPIGNYVNNKKLSLINGVFTQWISIGEIKSIFQKSSFEIEQMKGHLLFPRIFNNILMLKIMKSMNNFVLKNKLKFLYGSVYVKAFKSFKRPV